jgi:hypothetical protein
MNEDFTPPPGVDAIMRVLDRQKKRDAEWEAREERYRRESAITQAERRAFLEHCQPATLLEYTAWMIGYLREGGEPSSVTDYPFAEPAMQLDGSIGPSGSTLRATQAPTKWWVLAEVPESVPSLYGANSIKVLVPKELAFTPSDLPDTFHGHCGHSTFYFINGFKLVGYDATVYSDMLCVLAANL